MALLDLLSRWVAARKPPSPVPRAFSPLPRASYAALASQARPGDLIFTLPTASLRHRFCGWWRGAYLIGWGLVFAVHRPGDHRNFPGQVQVLAAPLGGKWLRLSQAKDLAGPLLWLRGSHRLDCFDLDGIARDMGEQGLPWSPIGSGTRGPGWPYDYFDDCIRRGHKQGLRLVPTLIEVRG